MNWKLIRQVYLSVYWNQRNTSSMWVTWFVFVVAAGLAIIPIFWNGGKTPWLWVVTIFTGVSCLNLFLWWMLSVPNLIQQCSPQNARLTPGLHAAVLQAFAAGWLANVLLFSFLFSLGAGHFILFFLGIGVVLLLITFAISLGNWLVGIPFYFSGFFFPYLKEFSIKSGLWDGDPLASTIAIVALLILVALFTKNIFGMKGDRAFALQEKLRKRQSMMMAKGLPINQSVTGWSKFLGPQSLYDVSLKRGLYRKTPALIGRRTSLLKFAFGFGLHWSFIVAQLTGFLLWGGGYYLAMHFFQKPGTDMRQMIRMFLPVGIGIFPLTAAVVILKTLYQTRKEQALVRLLPLLPNGNGLNRAMARICLLQFFATWVCGLIMAIALNYLLKEPGADSLKHTGIYISGVMLSTLPLCLFVLTDYASMKKLTANGGLLFLFVLTSGMVLLGLFTLVPQPFFLLIMGLLTIAILFMTYGRWKLSVNSPVALPVGRLIT